jgi:uncharacterized protein (TIGR00266 family)
MQFELMDRPDYGMACVRFDQAGESLVVESGSMVARDTGVAMKTQMSGGLLGAAKRKLLGGESLFLNTFTAGAAGDRLYLAPAPEGDLEVMEVSPGADLILQSGAFVAAEPGVTLDTKWAGFRGFFSGEGLFFLRVTGQGRVLVNSYGGIHPVELSGADPFIVDTSHIVGFTTGVDFSIRKIGGIKSLFLSGEGLVCEFRGAGTVWLQTRNPGSLAAFLDPFRRVVRSGGGGDGD